MVNFDIFFLGQRLQRMDAFRDDLIQVFPGHTHYHGRVIGLRQGQKICKQGIQPIYLSVDIRQKLLVHFFRHIFLIQQRFRQNLDGG